MKWLRNSRKVCYLANVMDSSVYLSGGKSTVSHYSLLPNITSTTNTTTTITTSFSFVSPFPKFSSLKLTTPKSLHHTTQNMSSNNTTSHDPDPDRDPEWNYTESDIAQKFLFFNVLKDGRIHVLSTPDVIVPPSFGASFGVQIRDVEISSQVSARVILPTTIRAGEKLPILVYVHGGGFCMNSAFSDEYTRFVSQIAVEGNAVVVSVEYGLFPARPIPACYEDSWAALQWVASRSNGSGPDPWINDHGDLRRIFVGGDSAGGNICHTVLAKVGSMELPGDAKVEGMILIHPYFGEDDKMWMYMCPSNVGPQDPRMKPAAEDLATVGCDRVLVLLAEKDVLYSAGRMYADELINSGWKGKLETMESKDKDHCFHYANHTDPEAHVIRRRIASFIRNQC